MDPSNDIVFDIQQARLSSKGLIYFVDAFVKTAEGEQLVDRTDQNLDAAGARTYWIRLVARKLRDMGLAVSAEALDRQLLAALQDYQCRHPELLRIEPEQENPLDATPREIRQEAEQLLDDPVLIHRVRDDIAYLGLAGESDNALITYLAGTSRLLDSPLAIVIRGASSSGKSHLAKRIARMMPPESIVQAHTLTPESMYYLPPGSLEHKAIFAGERVHRKGEAEASAKALREGLSDGHLVKLVTVRDQQTGELTARRIEQKGPWAYVETTTATSVGEETATRMLILLSDESPDQTARVVRLLGQEAAGQFSTVKRERIIAVHQCLQRLLEPMPVRIPWAGLLQLPETQPATRRMYAHLLNLIRAVALLRQHQHVLQYERGGPCLVADEHDYAIIRDLAIRVFAARYDPLPARSRQLLADLKARFAVGHAFSLQDAMVAMSADISEKQMRRRLGPLIDQGMLKAATTARPYAYLLTDRQEPEARLDLPEPERIAEFMRQKPDVQDAA